MVRLGLIGARYDAPVQPLRITTRPPGKSDEIFLMKGLQDDKCTAISSAYEQFR
jgi:hypothetical protein